MLYLYHNKRPTINPHEAAERAKLLRDAGVPFWDAYRTIFGVSGRQAIMRDIETTRLAYPVFKQQAK